MTSISTVWPSIVPTVVSEKEISGAAYTLTGKASWSPLSVSAMTYVLPSPTATTLSPSTTATLSLMVRHVSLPAIGLTSVIGRSFSVIF